MKLKQDFCISSEKVLNLDAEGTLFTPKHVLNG